MKQERKEKRKGRRKENRRGKGKRRRKKKAYLHQRERESGEIMQRNRRQVLIDVFLRKKKRKAGKILMGRKENKKWRKKRDGERW